MNKNRKAVKAAVEEKSNSPILGTFTGKCCDFNVMNNNDMHLSRKVFETLMASEEYKRALGLGHYIGFLSHPEDPDCQDDKNACIVMRDMRILDNGDIEGDFDLINTPVGQVVKTFQDAGVRYGLSIRGLGDVDGNGEVDPDQFIFRGFDLVRFPAYDDCIPEFKAIAASTDAKKKAAYKKICASIDTNLQNITSSEALEFIKGDLVEGSDEFNKVQDRINELENVDEVIITDPVEETVTAEIAAEVTQAKLNAMTNLYLDATQRIRDLENDLATAYTSNQELTVACQTSKFKMTRYKKIVANQLETAQQSHDTAEAENDKLTKRLNRVTASLKATRKNLVATQEQLKTSKDEYDRVVTANTKLKERVRSLSDTRKGDQEAIKASEDLNLKYQRKIEASSEAISQKDSAIEDLKQQLHETVVAKKQLESKASNLDEKNGELLSRVEAAEEMVYRYQQAYANLYANALGVYLPNLSVTAETSVDELKSIITAGTSTANIPAAPEYIEESDEIEDDFEEDDEFSYEDPQYSAEMVTM